MTCDLRDSIGVFREYSGGGRIDEFEGVEPQVEEETMAIAPAALIRQSIISDPIDHFRWETERSFLLNVHLINASVIEELTGLEPPPESISAETYARAGWPLFKSKSVEKPKILKGDFKSLKSVHQGGEQEVCFDVVTLPHFEPSFVPIAEMLRRVRISRGIQVRPLESGPSEESTALELAPPFKIRSVRVGLGLVEKIEGYYVTCILR